MQNIHRISRLVERIRQIGPSVSARWPHRALASVLAVSALAAGAPAPLIAADAPTARPLAIELMDAPVSREDVLETKVEIVTFGSIPQLRNDASFTLTGILPKKSIPLQIPRDEIATRATVHLKWTPSPALIPVRSQLIIRLNGEIQQTIAIQKENLGRPIVTDFALHPKKFKDVNQLEFDFVGSYADLCETPAHRSLWLDIDKDSSVTIEKQKIRVADELELLPAPFIDPATREQIVLPMVFASHPSDTAMQAAGVVASWAGRLADWRGLSVPVYYDRIPADTHFVVFATPESRPEIFEGLPEITGPEILMLDSPYSSWAKMLVIAGRNDEELLTAAQALALQYDTLAGSRAVMTDPVVVTKRRPYDADKWISTDRKVAFSELTDYPEQLRSKGALPDPIRLRFRLPPDLFILPRANVPLDLRYRYTPPPKGATASVRIRINESLMDIHMLESDSDGNETNVRRVPALDAMASWLRSLHIPAVYVDSENTLEFDFQYSLAITGGATQEKCPSLLIPDNQVEVVPNSTVDFRGFYHYAEMPNLRLFAQASYPFSRWADLSETVVVLSPDPDEADLSTMLTTLGRIGAQTGASATLVSVTTKPTEALVENRDVLYFGRFPSMTTEKAGAAGDGFLRAPILRQLSPVEEALSKNTRPVQVKADLVTSDRRAVLLGFESPVTEGRSVVALLTTPGEGTRVLQQKLATPGAFYDVDGATSFVTGTTSVNFTPSGTYWIGDLPWHQRIWFRLVERPVWLFGLALVFLLIASGLIYVLMTRVMAKRLLASRDAVKISSIRKS